MTFQAFVKCNEESKVFTEKKIEILVVDFSESRCTVRTEKDEMQTIPIEELVEGVCYDSAYVLENPNTLEYWRGFDAQ